MKALKKLKAWFAKKTRGKNLGRILLFGYLYGLVISLLITGLYVIFPKLVICSSLFGQRFCTPAGIFIGLLLSLPGYLIGGNLLSFLPNIHWSVSLTAVVVISGSIYYLIGYFIDQVRSKRLTLPQLLVYVVFIILLILVLSLLTLFR